MKKVPFIVLLLFALVLAACGGDTGALVDAAATEAAKAAATAAVIATDVADGPDGGDPTEVPTEEPTEEPTAEPTEEPTATPETTLAFGDTVQGKIEAGSKDSWTFFANTGDIVEITVTPLDDYLDVVLDIVDSSGNSIVGGEIDNYFGVEYTIITIPDSGVYTIIVRGYSDDTGKYDLSLILNPTEE